MAEEKEGGGGMSDAIFVVLVIVFLMVSWFLSGAAKNADVKGIFLSPPPPLGVGESIGLPSVADPYDTDYREETAAITDEIGVVKRELDAVHGMPSSPYAGKVEIVSQWSGPQHAPADEYVVIRAKQSNTERITISDWSLMSAVNKRTAYIGQGAEIYEPTGSSAVGAIVLSPGDEAIVATTRSPIGVSFRVNACSGYLDQFQEYRPQLPHDCPYPDTEVRSAPSSVASDNTCINYLQTLGQCRIDVAPSITLSDQCRAFITSKLTYQGCVAAHRADADFKTRQWRIYVGHTSELWRDKREVIVLLDSSGKVVDAFSY